MLIANYWVSFYTLVRKEIWRFLRIWSQTLLPPLITTSLYFIIFGHLVGAQLHPLGGFSYMQYIVPGLMMMAVINNAYMNTANSFYLVRFQRCIEELLVAPFPPLLILLGYVSAALMRAWIVGAFIAIVALFFTHLTIHHWGYIFAALMLSSVLFALAGFLNGMIARGWDDVSFVPTFILTPLTYLGGIFYSLKSLPPLWQKISLFNPVLYMVNAFRYGVLGISDVSIMTSLLFMTLLVIILFCWCCYWLKKGIGIRS